MEVNACQRLGPTERELVAFLVKPVRAVLSLYRIVGQVNGLSCLFQGVGVAGQAQVALAEVVGSQVVRDEHPQAYVEFAALNQQGPLDVFLDDVDVSSDLVWVVGHALVRRTDQPPELLQGRKQLDSSAPILIIRFTHPQVSPVVH